MRERLVDLQRAAHPGRRLDRAVVGREHRAHELLQHQADAERREQRLERPAVEKPDDRPLDQHAGQRRRPGTPPESATRIDSADVLGHQQLHDVGRVGAEHHQLAVRHVDDAHDAERDGQADRDEHQHRAEAQAEEQRLDRRRRSCATVSMRATRRRPRRAAPRRPARRSVPSGAVLEERRQPVADLGARGGRRASSTAASRASAIAAVERGQRQPGLDLVLDRGVGLRRRRAAAAARRVASSSERSISLTAASRTAASGFDSANRASAIRRKRRRRLLVPILVSSAGGAVPAGC